MKKTILTIIHIIFGAILFAQNSYDSSNVRPVNGININLIGDASIISINYERIFLIKSIFFIAGNVGLGYNEESRLGICWGSCSDSPPEKYLTIPHRITGNLEKGKVFFEFGL